MENYKFSTLEYRRPDLEARRAKLVQWKAGVERAESYDALRARHVVIRVLNKF